MPRVLLLAALIAAAGPLWAQTPPLAKAAETITGADVARHIGVIADDSMLGRDTPSRGLDLTAAYIAAQFEMFGLKPGGDSGTYLQRYTISRRRLARDRSRIAFMAGGREILADFMTRAFFVGGEVPPEPAIGGALLVAGPHTLESAKRLDLRGKVILYLAPPLPDENVQQQVAQFLLAASKGLVVLNPRDSVEFAARLPASDSERLVVGNGAGAAAVHVRQDVVAGVLRAAGVDLAAARASTAPLARPVKGLTIRFDLQEEVLSSITAPNTVGILEGSDPKLKHEYLVYSAHMDHVGVHPGEGSDSIYNGADDDASGTAGVIELAEAFTRPGARPRRSVIFLTVSGEEKAFWGSRYFIGHPPVPRRQLVADLNIDMIGRNWKDTVVVIGQEHSDLGATLARVSAAHPELDMAPIGDLWPQERFYFRSDHYSFARYGVPILFFFTGVHADYHQVTDSPDKIDADKEARILRLLFYLGQEIASADRRPQWNQESYRQIVQE